MLYMYITVVSLVRLLKAILNPLILWHGKFNACRHNLALRESLWYIVHLFLSSGWGRVINISSVHGLRASPNKAAYVSAKHGIVGLTKVHAGTSIRNALVNILHSGIPK